MCMMSRSQNVEQTPNVNAENESVENDINTNTSIYVDCKTSRRNNTSNENCVREEMSVSGGMVATIQLRLPSVT